MFFVYILYSRKLNKYYVGSTDDVDKRLKQHNSIHYENAFTYRGIPWELFHTIPDLESRQAYNIEEHIKNMKSKIYIKNLKQFPEMNEKLKEKYK